MSVKSDIREFQLRVCRESLNAVHSRKYIGILHKEFCSVYSCYKSIVVEWNFNRLLGRARRYKPYAQAHFMLRYMYIACLIKADNRNTKQILSTSAPSQFMSSYINKRNRQKMQWVLTVLPCLKIRFTLYLPYLSPHPKNLIYVIPGSVKSYHYPR